MLDRADDHHSRRPRVAERVVVLEVDAEMPSEHVQPVARELRPRTLRDADAVQPRRLDHGAVVDAASRRQRTLVEVGVGDGGPPREVPVDHSVVVGEAGLPRDVPGGDPVDGGVEPAEVVTAIQERLVLERHSAVPEADYADLADAADPRAGRLDVHDDEVRDVVGHRWL